MVLEILARSKSYFIDLRLPGAVEVVNLQAKTFLCWEVHLQGIAYICDMKCRHYELYAANIFDLLGDRFRKEANMARNTRITMKSTTRASLFRKTFVCLAWLQDLLQKHGEKLSVSSMEFEMCRTEGVQRLWWLNSRSRPAAQLPSPQWGLTHSPAGPAVTEAGEISGVQPSSALQLLLAVLKDVAVWNGVQHFSCLQLEFFHKQVWFCFVGGSTEKKVGRK